MKVDFGMRLVNAGLVSEEDMKIGGPAKIKLALAKWNALGPAMLELIQPVEGESVWASFIESSGEGLHHIGFSTPNFDKVVSKVKEEGGTVIASGVYDKKMRWCYVETAPGNTRFEIMERIELASVETGE